MTPEDQERAEAHAEKHASEKELSESKWAAHREQHDSIARNLAEYKTQSNEWRGSLSDLRLTFANKADVEALEGRLNAIREELRQAIITEREERRDQQNLRQGQERGVSQSTAIVVGAIAPVATVLTIAVILANVLP